ncbi:MAG: LytR C-terminal domain-containing protein [SAR324 cluster bacterium]|nr:LytR C-terminal domain-containing protein [SAR324 cluster bacterium]
MRHLISFSCLMFMFLASSPTGWAQKPVSAGHMLDEIQLQTAMPESLLILQGTFTPEQFSNVEVISKKNTPSVDIKIPNSFINNLKLPKLIKYKEKDILETVSIQEDVNRRDNGSIAFEVTLALKGWDMMDVLFDRGRSNNQKMVFVIRSQKRVTEQAPAESASVPAPKEPSGPPPVPTVTATSSRTLEKQEFKKPEKEAIPVTADVPKPMTPASSTGKEMRPMNPTGEPDKILLHPVSAMMVYQRPSRLQVSILNASHQVNAAQRLAVFMERHQRRMLEDKIGMKLEVTNISSVREKFILPKTKIYYRPNYLDSALKMSEVIPGEQIIESMPLDRRGKLGIDVEIYVGENFE